MGETKRGELPQRLTELALTQAETSRAAVMWSNGEIHAPLIQLEELANRCKAEIAACEAAILSAQVEYRRLRDARRESNVVFGRWSDVA